MEIISGTYHRQQIEALLEGEKLPVKDLPASLENFIIVIVENDVVAVSGLEVYGDHGLLRSLAVKAEYRNQGIADQLVQKIERLAVERGLKDVYLLTETAAGYFTRKNYQTVIRDSAPEEIKRSSEFSSVCPQSAMLMIKSLT
ncbi:MAG: arsenic resistance N-acetyltransferase ArsN2 [Mucilaginibacter sp.]